MRARSMIVAAAAGVAASSLLGVPAAQAVPSYRVINSNTSFGYVFAWSGSNCTGSKQTLVRGETASGRRSFKSTAAGTYWNLHGSSYTLVASRCYNSYDDVKVYNHI